MRAWIWRHYAAYIPNIASEATRLFAVVKSLRDPSDSPLRDL